jgi:hypothetical protein
MLRKTFLLIVLMAVAGAFLPVWGDSSAPPRVRVAVVQETLTGTVSPGTVTCVGGQPSGSPNPFAPCSPGTREVLTRGVINQASEQVTQGPAELLAGTSEMVMNCNLDGKTMAGPCWGTFKWTVKSPFLGDPGEFWEGVWFGDFDFTTLISSFRGVGYGRGTRLEGLQIEAQGAYPSLLEMTGTVVVRVVNPQAR